MRLLVCGGRDFKDEEFVFRTLDKVHAKRTVTTLIHGGATGADYLGWLWSQTRLIPSVEYKADWSKHGKSAGPKRNQTMIEDGKPDGVVAFHGGRGTADMIGRAKAAGIMVYEPRKSTE